MEKAQKLIRWFLYRPATYHFLRPVLRLSNLRDENIAYRIWVRFLVDNMQKAYSHKQPVIWLSAFTPSEIAYGLRGVPFIPEIFASLVAYLGWSRHPLALASSHITTDVCSFYRCTLGLILEGYLPTPDLLISFSYLCDGANKFFHYLSQLYGRPHLMLDPPYTDGVSSRRYMVSQLKEVIGKACDILNLDLDESALSKSLTLSNQARVYMEEVNQLRRSTPSPLPGNEGLSYLAGMGFYSLGSRWGVDFFQRLYQCLEAKVVKREGYLPREKYRLLWLHHIRPYYKNNIFEFLGERQAAVSFEEGSYLYWPPLNLSHPWESLAIRILSNVWAGPLERRIEAIWKMVEDYRIDGVIHFSHWGCRQTCGGAGVIGDFLKERGIAYTILPGDGTDADNYSPGQTRTRLEAMIEMLG